MAESGEFHWKAGRSLVLEIALASLFASGHVPHSLMPKECADFLGTLPKSLCSDLRAFFCPSPHDGTNCPFSAFMLAATAAGVLNDTDYRKVSLSMRSLTVPESLKRLCQAVHIPYSESEPSLQCLERINASYGKRSSANLKKVLAALERIVGDGKEKQEFWFTIDNLYFSFLEPWLQSRHREITKQEMSAQAIVEGWKGVEDSTPEFLAWFHRRLHDTTPKQWLQDPDKIYPHRTACIVVLPFGPIDTWENTPTQVMISFNTSGDLLSAIREQLETLGERLRALSDPTRLLMLRLMEHEPKNATVMAAALQLARPTVSIHARLLKECGFIDEEIQGRKTLYRRRPDAIRRVLSDLERILDLPAEE